MSITAMKLALEALGWTDEWRPQGLKERALTALRTAIEATEKQEPYGYFRYDIRLDAWVQNRESNKGVAFYTTPPAAQRKHVTDGNPCWCEPETCYTDPETGASVIVHKGPQ